MKKVYAWIECIGCKIRGYDTFICPWEDLASMIMEPLDNIEMKTKVSFEVTLYEFTDEELQGFCNEREVDSWE